MKINIKLEIGIDALDFIKSIPNEIWKKIYTIVFDPPYFDSDNIEHQKRFAIGKGKMTEHDRIALMMDSNQRNEILNYIKLKVDKCVIIYFHSLDNKFPFQKHVWYNNHYVRRISRIQILP